MDARHRRAPRRADHAQRRVQLTAPPFLLPDPTARRASSTTTAPPGASSPGSTGSPCPMASRRAHERRRRGGRQRSRAAHRSGRRHVASSELGTSRRSRAAVRLLRSRLRVRLRRLRRPVRRVQRRLPRLWRNGRCAGCRPRESCAPPSCSPSYEPDASRAVRMPDGSIMVGRERGIAIIGNTGQWTTRARAGQLLHLIRAAAIFTLRARRGVSLERLHVRASRPRRAAVHPEAASTRRRSPPRLHGRRPATIRPPAS